MSLAFSKPSKHRNFRVSKIHLRLRDTRICNINVYFRKDILISAESRNINVHFRMNILTRAESRNIKVYLCKDILIRAESRNINVYLRKDILTRAESRNINLYFRKDILIRAESRNINVYFRKDILIRAESRNINVYFRKDILIRAESRNINVYFRKDILIRAESRNITLQYWKLLHDNELAHRAIIVRDYLVKHSVSVLPHPSYSPDIAPCDFFFFPKLKMTLKGRRFSSSSEVIENATVELNKFGKIDFELAFQQLFSCWKKCVDNQGSYF
ncbi:hypothetical protein LAZ67_X001346 [Cordylochernes scorpioides]|uniref:Histone-lysine N-methyltransferase SETMAR n=1 Tax=Cordylochernes scorpioides TaxID=51811 RepID=A0ABY6LVH9_9ARAC|nr:hypothetical protein LAZ67_X001346 [Cordylochernes scorpioides]